MSNGIGDKSLGQFDFQDVVSSESMDTLSSLITVPVTKLDADQYMAEDLDGVTESLFGSGNLNFLMMQANQTNETIAGNNSPGFDAMESILSPGSGEIYSGTAYPGIDAHGIHDGIASGREVGVEGPLGHNDDSNVESNIADGNFTHNAIGSITASGTATDRLTERPLTALNGFDGEAGGDSGTVQNGRDGTDGANGMDGSSGSDEPCGSDCGTLINIDIDSVVNIDLGDVTNLVTTTVNEVMNLTEVVNNITDITNNVTSDITNIVTTIIDTVLNSGEGGLTLVLDGVLSDLTTLNLDLISGDTVLNLVDQAIDISPVADIVGGLLGMDSLTLVDLNSVYDILGGPGHGHASGDTDLGLGLDAALGNLDLVNGITDVAFNPVEDLVGDIDILGNLGLDLFGNNETSNGAGDSDLTLGLDIDLVNHDLLGGGIDVPLDVVESITGDIDLDLGIAANLLGQTADGLVDNLAGGTGTENVISVAGDALGGVADGLLGTLVDGETPDILSGGDIGGILPGIQIDFIEADADGIDFDAPLHDILPVFGGGEANDVTGDTDIILNLDIDVAGLEVPEVDLDIPLDPIESITGDIDLGLGAAISLLDGSPATGGLGDILGGEYPLAGGGEDAGDQIAWPENILPDPGDLIGDTLGGISAPALPDPVGGVAEGLGGLLGGHGGHGGHHGGLFG